MFGAANKSQTGKELANTPGGAYLSRVTNSDRIRAAGSFYGRARRLPGPSYDGLWVTRTAPGRVVDPSDRLPLSMFGERVREKTEAEARSTCRTKAGGAVWIVTFIGARRRRLSGGVSATRCFQVDDVPMANPQFSGRPSDGGGAPSQRGRIPTFC